MGRVAKPKVAPKRVLRLLDLEHSKRSLLSTLGSPDSKRAYEFAVDHFVAWYCSEPRLAFNKTVVLRYRLELEGRRLAPATINLRLAAVRRLAFEAADTGLLSPELAAGIARVKGAKRIGVRLGNWLTADQSRNLLAAPDVQTLKGRRDRAILALMLGCGLRRGEVTGLKVDHLQQREEHWVIADLIGKAAHIRTVSGAGLGQSGCRSLAQVGGDHPRADLPVRDQEGIGLGRGNHRKSIWHIVKENAGRAGIAKLSPHDCRRYAECRIMPNRSNKVATADSLAAGRAA
jgi:integrase